MSGKSCDTCGIFYIPRSGPGKGGRASRYCSGSCNSKAAKRRKLAPILAAGFDCPTCKKHFTPTRKTKYCSTRCRINARAVHLGECAVCGKQFNAFVASSRTCSRSCQNILRDREPVKVKIRCRLCNKAFEKPRHLGRVIYCSTRCRDKTRDKGRAAYLNNAQRIRRYRIESNTPADVEKVSVIAVFERDNWTCQICGFPVNRGTDKYDPLSPTIDHVLPVSKGGSHTYGNVRCAHFRCNTVRNNRTEGELAAH